MARRTCFSWIKFFIWAAVTSGLATIFSTFGVLIFFSFVLGGVIASPILFVDYIVLHYIDKDIKSKKVEEGRIKQEELENLGDDEYNVVLCPKCGKKNLIGTTHCNNCGKDLRTIK